MEREKKSYKSFLVSISLASALLMSGIFLGITIQNRKLIHDEMVTQARTHFQSMVMVRKWNANHGGVYVEKAEGVVSNPYLKNPDITTVNGKMYTKKNPAIMTREISSQSDSSNRLKFHISSLKLLNPANKPDEFETEALKGFENGLAEAYRVETLGGSNFFRYMAPLYVEEACLECHAYQGYSIGDVRGGISVRMNVDHVYNRLSFNTVLIVLIGLLAVGLLLSIIFYYTSRLVTNLSVIRELIERAAISDGLTGLFNRRHIIHRFQEEFDRAKRQGKDLSCILFDIDHFKRINDVYGHPVGDEVLKEVARLVCDSVRIYDIVGRYGGEEFIVLLPYTSMEDARNLAERLRETICRDLKAKGLPERETVSISLGVTSLLSGDGSIDDIIKRADKSMYEAKNSGRNRTCCSCS